MKILITGGLGYLSSSLVHYFSSKDYEILVCSRKKIFFSIKNKFISSKKINWENEHELNELCKDIDVVIHAAGMNSIDCLNDPFKANQCNHLNTKKLADAAASCNVKKFIYISTIHVYKSPLLGTIDEETKLTNLHPYATSHRLGEEVTIAAAEDSGMKSIIIRLSNVFGIPKEKNSSCWKLLINNLCCEAIKNNSITISSDGSDLRDFISLNDFNRSIDHLIDYQQIEKSVIINVGSGVTYSVISVANIIKDIYKNILDKEILVRNKKNVTMKKEFYLKYNTDKLKNTGHHLPDDIYNEIKSILNDLSFH